MAIPSFMDYFSGQAGLGGGIPPFNQEDQTIPAAATETSGMLPAQSPLGFGGGQQQAPGLGQPAQGGFFDTVGANRNALIGLGLGLMGGQFGNRFGQAQQGYQAGAAQDASITQHQQSQALQQQHLALQQQQLALTGDIKEYNFAKQQGYKGSFQDWMAIKQQQQNKAGLNPTYYYTTDPTTGERKLNIGQLQTGGGMNPVQLPPGAVLADPNTQWLDTGTGFVPVSKRPPAGAVPGGAGAPGVPNVPQPAQPGADAGGVIQKNIIGREEQEQIGQGYGKEFTQFQNDSIAAQRSNSTLARLKQLSPQVYEGAAGPAQQHVRSLLTSFGIKSDTVAAGDEFNALSNKIVLDAAGGSLGTGFSNADRDFLASTVPVMSQTAQGRMQLIDTLQKINDRKIEVAKLAREYRKKNGNMEGFPEAMAAYSEAKPLFPEPPAQGGGSAPAPGGGGGGAPKISSKAQYDALPSGSQYVDPNGVTRTKK